MTKLCYSTPITAFSAVISFIWFILFVFYQKRIIRNQKTEMKVDFKPAAIVLIAVCLSVYFVYIIWGSGYLSLAPLSMIDNGQQHIDTLFHSAIAESYKRSIKASTLLNNEAYIPYHTFSHLLMGIVSKIMDIPAVIGYCFIYPVLFIPLYTISQFIAVLSAKGFFAGIYRINLIDIVLIVLFNVGVPFCHLYCARPASDIISESFMIANTLAFFSYAIAFYYLKVYRNNRKATIAFCLFFIPVAVFLISWSKISVGLLFTVSVIYYLFRTKMTSVWAWLLNIAYFLVCIVSYILFNRGFNNGSDSSLMEIKFLSNDEYCSGILGTWGHLLFCSIFFISYICMELKSKRITKQDIITGKTIWIELLIIIGIISFLPPLFLKIPGASAFYFSMAYTVPSLCILCGQNYFDNDKINRIRQRSLGLVLCVSVSIWSIIMCSPALMRTHTYSLDHNSDLSGVLFEIRELAGKHPEEYTVFLDEDAFSLNVLEDSRKAAYVFPALTGIGVINASYRENGEYYSFAGDQLEATYGISNTDNDHKISFEEAEIKAREMGKKRIIHVTENGYEIIDL